MVIFLLFLFQNALAGVTASGLVTADAPRRPASVVEVSGAALAGVTAHTVLPAARLQDRLPRDVLAVHDVDEDPVTHVKHTLTLGGSSTEGAFVIIFEISSRN